MLKITIMGKDGEVLLKGEFPSIGAAFDHAESQGLDVQGNTFMGRFSAEDGVEAVELLALGDGGEDETEGMEKEEFHAYFEMRKATRVTKQ